MVSKGTGNRYRIGTKDVGDLRMRCDELGWFIKQGLLCILQEVVKVDRIFTSQDDTRTLQEEVMDTSKERDESYNRML